MLSYREYRPPASVARWIECAWTLRRDGAVSDWRVPPDGCLDILYDRGSGLRVVGAMSTEQSFDYPDGAWLTGIRFRPGMARLFLHASAALFTDVTAPLEDLWPNRAEQLRNRLDDAISIGDCARILLGALPVPEGSPDPVQQAIEALANAGGNMDMDVLAGQANLSPRQFRRRCPEESGLTPKRLARVLRFRRACRIAELAGRVNWAGIAVDAGYFDQAHFIRDFREFTGAAPTSVFSNT
jgi:AraC-like DNA-binding protein